MGTYRKEWDCCGSVTETEAWEPECCPFCTDDAAPFRKDAKRYRWLRDVGDETWVPMGKRPGVNFTHEIDQAIDAAIASARGIGAA